MNKKEVFIMIKIIAVLLSAALTFSLTACSKTSPDNEESSGIPQTSSVPEE